jgi:GT2 family glycosyltransferase
LQQGIVAEAELFDDDGPPPRGALALTVIVLTKDEERDLPDCLASVDGLAEAVVVLDSGSRDQTIAIARRFTPHVYVRMFTGYASQRNAALALAETPWVLFLDADERLTEAGRAELRAVLADAAERPDDAPVGYAFPRHNDFFGRVLRGGGWWPDYQLRLLRRDLARYDAHHEVHEIVVISGALARLREPLLHRNYDSWDEFRAKQRDYAAYHADDLARRGIRPRPWTYATMPVREFRRRFVTLGGWHDGGLGFALATAMAWYEGVAYWRMRKAEGGSGKEVVVSDGAATTARASTSHYSLLTSDLSVVVVSRNTRELTLRCLASVGASLVGEEYSWEVILVDNASGDGTVEAVREGFPEVRVIAAGGNRGFSAGNNLGIAAARGRSVLLLNPDAEAVGDAIPRLLDGLLTDPGVGIVGPALRYPDGSPQPSRRRFPTRLTAFLESTIVQQYWRGNRVLDRYFVNDRPEEARQEVDWLNGACLLVRGEVLERIGGFDEGYFMYSEELDLCERARAAGWRVVYDPTVTVIHHEGASSAQAVPRRHIDFNTSKVRYYRRRYGRLFGEALRLFLLLTYVVQIGQEGAKWLVGHKRALRRQRIGAYLAVLRSGLRLSGEYYRTSPPPPAGGTPSPSRRGGKS